MVGRRGDRKMGTYVWKGKGKHGWRKVKRRMGKTVRKGKVEWREGK